MSFDHIINQPHTHRMLLKHCFSLAR